MPNAAHFHLIMVHAAPAILWAALMVVLFARWFDREAGLRVLAVLFVLIAAVGLVLAANSGEGAVDVLRGDPTVDDAVVHEHEELGELVFPLGLMTAFMTLIWFVLSRKDDKHVRGWPWWVAFVMVLGTAAVTTYAGHLGGRIRHPEVLPQWSAGSEMGSGAATLEGQSMDPGPDQSHDEDGEHEHD